MDVRSIKARLFVATPQLFATEVRYLTYFFHDVYLRITTQQNDWLKKPFPHVAPILEGSDQHGIYTFFTDQLKLYKRMTNILPSF